MGEEVGLDLLILAMTGRVNSSFHLMVVSRSSIKVGIPITKKKPSLCLLISIET